MKMHAIVIFYFSYFGKVYYCYSEVTCLIIRLIIKNGHITCLLCCMCALYVILLLQHGYTPLHLASQSGHEGLVRVLLNSPGVQADTPTIVNVRSKSIILLSHTQNLRVKINLHFIPKMFNVVFRGSCQNSSYSMH